LEWTLECKAFDANRNAAIRIRPALEGVVATFSSRRGRVFSETVPYPEKEFLSMFRLVEQTAVFVPQTHLLRMSFRAVCEAEVAFVARASGGSSASSSSVETDVSWINLSDAVQAASGTNDQD